MRSKVITIFICITASFLLILTLQVSSNFRVNKTGQNFIRKWTGLAKRIKSRDLGSPACYFAGKSGNRIYIGNYVEKNRLLELNERLQIVNSQSLTCISDSLLPFRNLRMRVDSLKLSCIDLDKGTVYYNQLNKLPVLYRHANKNPVFAFDGIQEGQNLFLKTFDTISQMATIGKYGIAGEPIAKNKNILQKQIDGILSVDGRLLYNNELKLFYYIYFYRNEIICFDSSLNIKYRSFTIDSTTYAKVQFRHVAAGNYTSLSVPPPFVNKTACVKGNFIYISATMRSRNEKEDAGKTNSTIDVYDAKSGRYQSSFYLPDYQEHKVSDMGIYDDQLLVIQGTFLSLFSLSSR